MLRMKSIHVKALLLAATGLVLLLNGLLIIPKNYFNSLFGNQGQLSSFLLDHADDPATEASIVPSSNASSEIEALTAVGEKEAVLPAFKVFLAKFQNLEFTYHLPIPTEEDVCVNATLFVFVPSRPTAFEVRAAIRSTWAADKTSDVIFKFMLGSPEDLAISDLLAGEQKEFNDLILYDIEDTYENLYLKVHAALSWHQAFCNSKYVLKADDDTIVDLNRLLYWIDNELNAFQTLHPSIIFGGIWKLGKPIRDKTHKWHVSTEVYPLRVFPNYCNGPTYMLSTKAVADILKTAPNVKAFPIEDILYTGVVSAKAGVQRKDIWHHFRWSTRVKIKEECNKNQIPLLIALYSFKASQMQRAYKRLKNIKC